MMSWGISLATVTFRKSCLKAIQSHADGKVFENKWEKYSEVDSSSQYQSHRISEEMEN